MLVNENVSLLYMLSHIIILLKKITDAFDVSVHNPELVQMCKSIGGILDLNKKSVCCIQHHPLAIRASKCYNPHCLAHNPVRCH